jgi:hypothetical protein
MSNADDEFARIVHAGNGGSFIEWNENTPRVVVVRDVTIEKTKSGKDIAKCQYFYKGQDGKAEGKWVQSAFIPFTQLKTKLTNLMKAGHRLFSIRYMGQKAANTGREMYDFFIDVGDEGNKLPAGK